MVKLNEKKVDLKYFQQNKELNLTEKTKLFYDFFIFNQKNKHSNYRITSKFGSDAQTPIINPYTGEEKEMICFVSNDYLGFTKHPKMIEASF